MMADKHGRQPVNRKGKTGQKDIPGRRRSDVLSGDKYPLILSGIFLITEKRCGNNVKK
ncbi:hypothetical protein [Tatumella terrea]|uniref:hypothetical protein n=1 Tax=Tatumella terrea TaxID=419007 RepID=UPI0031D06729